MPARRTRSLSDSESMASWVASEVIELPGTSPSQTYVSPSCGLLVHSSCNLHQSLVAQKETSPNRCNGTEGAIRLQLDHCASPVSPVSTMSSPGSSASLKSSFNYHTAPAPAAPAQLSPPSLLKLPRRIAAVESAPGASRGAAGLLTTPRTTPTVSVRAKLADSSSTTASMSTRSTCKVVSPCDKSRHFKRRKNTFMTCLQESCTKSRLAKNHRHIDQDALVARHRFVCQHAYKKFVDHLITRTAFMHIVRESGRGSNIADPFAATFFEGAEMLCPNSRLSERSLSEEARHGSPLSTEAKLLLNRKAQEIVCRELWIA